MARSAARLKEKERRGTRLGFRVDAETKKMVVRAAALERRSMTDYCLAALTEATRATIAQHESLVLSALDREAFFRALVLPPKPNARMQRAFKVADRAVAR